MSQVTHKLFRQVIVSGCKKNLFGITNIGKSIVSNDVGTSIAHPCEMDCFKMDKLLHDILTLSLYLLVTGYKLALI